MAETASDHRPVSRDTGWRIVSCMVVGLLMLGTSVVYGKFSLKLLEVEFEPAAGERAIPSQNAKLAGYKFGPN